MTLSPQTLPSSRPSLAGTPAASLDDRVRLTVEACEQAHEACLRAVREALHQRRSAPPLDRWLTGASLCRTLAEVLAVEATEVRGKDADRGDRRPGTGALSPWAVGMAQLCAGLCRELAARDAAEAQTGEAGAPELQQACESCAQACIRLLADAGPPAGGLPAARAGELRGSSTVVPLSRPSLAVPLPPCGADRAAA